MRDRRQEFILDPVGSFGFFGHGLRLHGRDDQALVHITHLPHDLVEPAFGLERLFLSGDSLLAKPGGLLAKLGGVFAKPGGLLASERRVLSRRYGTLSLDDARARLVSFAQIDRVLPRLNRQLPLVQGPLTCAEVLFSHGSGAIAG